MIPILFCMYIFNFQSPVGCLRNEEICLLLNEVELFLIVKEVKTKRVKQRGREEIYS